LLNDQFAGHFQVEKAFVVEKATFDPKYMNAQYLLYKIVVFFSEMSLSRDRALTSML